MAFEYRFNVIRFYSKLNRFVLSPRKKPNHFVLKIRPGGFADYTCYLYQALITRINFEKRIETDYKKDNKWDSHGIP